MKNDSNSTFNNIKRWTMVFDWGWYGISSAFVCYQNFTFPPHILLAPFHPNMEEDQRISKMSNFVQEFEDDEQFQSAGGSQHSIGSPNPTENGGSTPTTSTTSKKKRNLPGNPGKKNLFILLSKCHGYVQDNSMSIRKCLAGFKENIHINQHKNLTRDNLINNVELHSFGKFYWHSECRFESWE